VAQNFLSTFSGCKSSPLILMKNVLGYVLGDFLQTHLVTLVGSLLGSAVM
jgi:hypothetical protein